jgi:RNA polymerase sigma factor (sigma-70 family)
LTELDDNALLARCRAGDESAWRALVERYAALILSVPRRHGLKAAPSEDVFADVCLALVRALPSIRDPQALPQWLIRSAARATWSVSRKLKQPVPDSAPALTGPAPPDRLVSDLEEEQRVREALRRASPRCRRLLELLYFRAPTPTYDEIAREMGMPRGSLGPTRRRCLDRLRRRLENPPAPPVSRTRKRPPRSRDD